jgi:hypothetical protein
MPDLIAELEWGTLERGFAWVDGVFQHIHPRRSRGGAAFVSTHGAIVEEQHRVPFDKPAKFLAPAERSDQKEATLMKEGLHEASETLFAIADLKSGRYSVFKDQTGLFREFAGLKTPDDFLIFANRFGPLGGDACISVVNVVPHEPRMKGLFLFWTEPLTFWQAETRLLNEVVGLWDLFQDSGTKAFEFHIDDKKAVLSVEKANPFIDIKRHKGWNVADRSKDPVGFAKLKKSDKQEWPKIVLAKLLTVGTKDRIDFGVANAEKGLSVSIMPKGLIGALWLQAALAVSGGKDFRQCHECQTWFEVATGQGRSDKLYCSTACRMRAYRKRKKESQ